MAKNSRLTRYTEKKQKRTILLSILGILLIFIVLFKFGIPLLVNFSLFIAGNNQDEQTNNQETISYIPPPSFDSLPEATKDNQLKASGISKPETIVELYINGKKINQQKTDEKGKFSFEVNLNQGDNTIRAKTIENNKESDFSDPITVIYKNSPPSLEITSPSDGQAFGKGDKFIEVQGHTDANVKVTVNDFVAAVNESNIFSYFLGLKDGDNEIKVIATDTAGNETEKTINVNYSP